MNNKQNKRVPKPSEFIGKKFENVEDKPQIEEYEKKGKIEHLAPSDQVSQEDEKEGGLEEEVEKIKEELLPKQELKPDHVKPSLCSGYVARKELENHLIGEEKELPKPEPRYKALIKLKDLGWYLKIVERPVFYLASVEIFVYFLSIVPTLKQLMLEVVEPLTFILELIVFGWLGLRLIKKYQENFGQVAVTGFLAGFGTGLIMAIFRIFWLQEFWTLFNLITEPVVIGLEGLLMAVVVAGICKITHKSSRI